MLNDDNFETFLRKPRGDKLIRLNISRNTLIAFAISIFLHLLALLFLVPKIDLNPSPRATTLEVSLAPKPTAPDVAPIPQPAPPKELPTPTPKVIAKKPTSKPSKPKPRDFSVPETMTRPEPSAQQVPISPRPEPPSPQPASPADAPTDMMAMVNQKRAQREAQEADAARQNAAAVAAERGPSIDEKRDANIKRNFQNGTNGIFEITRLESRSASFTFLGWTNSLSNARREFFEVEATNGQDVRLVMIRRMIGLIRTHYQGDFDWESRRLNRTIVKSARVEDSAELEEFLMQEFFGQNYKTAL